MTKLVAVWHFLRVDGQISVAADSRSDDGLVRGGPCYACDAARAHTRSKLPR